MSPKLVTRFAPSPNGFMHLGHALSALTGWRIARDSGGVFLLRIEDIDQGRSRAEFVEAIFEDLHWLGIDWPLPVRRQSEHFADYEHALRRLRDLGLVYPCFATRSEINAAIEATGLRPSQWPRDPDGAPVYPGLYKDLPADEVNRLMWEGRSFAWRLDMAKAHAMAREIAGGPLFFTEEEGGPQGRAGRIAVDPEPFGDIVIARKDVPTSYHLAVTLDDAAQGVTLVTRGRDLFPATHIHRILQTLFGLPEPRYHHHRLVRDADGRRLSKTAKDRGLRDLRAEGLTPDDVRKLIGLA